MSLVMNSTVRDQMRGALLNGMAGGLYIYKGTLPGELQNFDPSNYTADLLVQFSVYTLSNNTSLNLIEMTSHTPVNASATGTATWWAASNGVNGVYGDVTDEFGDGTLRLDDVNIISGNLITIQNLNIGMN